MELDFDDLCGNLTIRIFHDSMSDRSEEWLRPPQFPSPLRVSPQIPLFFTDNIKSTVFLSAACYLMSSTPQKTEKSPNLNPKQRNNPRGEASRAISARGGRSLTRHLESLFCFSWTFSYLSRSSTPFFFHLVLFTSGSSRPLCSFLGAFPCH